MIVRQALVPPSPRAVREAAGLLARRAARPARPRGREGADALHRSQLASRAGPRPQSARSSAGAASARSAASAGRPFATGPPRPSATPRTGGSIPASPGGGILIDHGWHAFYVVSAWLSAAPRTVAARLETRKHQEYPVEDTVDLFLVYATATAEIFLTWARQRARESRARSSARKAVLRLDGGSLDAPRRRRDPQGRGVERAFDRGGLAPPRLVRRRRGGASSARSRDAKWRGRNLAEAILCANVMALARESSRQGGVPLPIERMRR